LLLFVDCWIETIDMFKKKKKEDEEDRMTTEDYFRIIAKENPLDFLSKHICPYLVGTEWDIIRKCSLLMCVSNDRNNQRMRLHLLLYGEPGSGKTEFLTWWQRKMNGKLINSELTSKIGLVGDARGKTIVPGLLARYDGHILLVDELDKMKQEDQNGLLQAMEEGSYTITKGRSSQQFQAEIRVMASCNDLSRIQKPLVDRFDFPLKVSRVPRVQRAEHVSEIIDSFMGKEAKDYSAVVSAYLQWAKTMIPTIERSEEDSIKQAIKNYILETDANVETVSYRSLEFSILRMAYAIATLEQSMMSEQHVRQAIELKDQLLKNFPR